LKKEQILTQPLDAANRSDDMARGLHAASHMAEVLGVEGHEVRPCIAVYFAEGCRKGMTFVGRNGACHLIVVELRRLGFGELELLPYLREWNEKNQPPLRESELRSVKSSAYKKLYKYGCNNAKLTGTCIGKDNCPFVLRGKGIYKKKVLWREFTLKGWQRVLSDAAKMIYNVALPEMEYRRQISPGGRIYVNQRELATIIGRKSHSRIGQYLEELHNRGLIVYLHGDPLKKNRKASEIIRVVPVPEVPEIYRIDARRDV
jgi:hypothetical protein